jgi:hypothetical protein
VFFVDCAEQAFGEACSPRKLRGIDASAFLAAHATGRHLSFTRLCASQPDSRPCPIFIDEFHPRGLQHPADGLIVDPGELGLAGGELGATDRRRRFIDENGGGPGARLRKKVAAEVRLRARFGTRRILFPVEACAGYLTCVLLYDASTRLWRLPKN